jgi:sugar phosphate isomerase/epimerase
MLIGSAKLITSTTLEADLMPFICKKLQLNVLARNFNKVDHSKLSHLLRKYDIRPFSIHYHSSSGIDKDFIEHIKKLKDIYMVDLFTIHPRFKSQSAISSFLEARKKELIGLQVDLSYEFSYYKKGIWSCCPNEVAKIDFSFTSLTFDTAHLSPEMDTIETIDPLLDRVSVIHLSNVDYASGKNHLRIREGDRDLLGFVEYLKEKEYHGQVILEYQSRNVYHLIEDMGLLEKMID